MIRRIGMFVENIYFFFAISVASGGYLAIPNRLAGGTIELGAQNIYATVSTAVILTGLVIIYAVMWRQIVPVISHATLLNIFGVLAFASGFSSFSPDVSFRRTGTLIVYVAFAYYAVCALSGAGHHPPCCPQQR